MNIKLDDFKTGEPVTIQIIKKVDVNNDVNVIKEIHKQIKEALSLEGREHANRS